VVIHASFPLATNAYTRSGYPANGWGERTATITTDQERATPDYQDGQTVSNFTADLPLLANWKKSSLVIKTIYTDPNDPTQTPQVLEPTHAGHVALLDPSVTTVTTVPAAQSYELVDGVATITNFSATTTQEIWYKADLPVGFNNIWYDTGVSVAPTATEADLALRKLYYTSTDAKGGTPPDPQTCYAVDKTSYHLDPDNYTRTNYGTDGWSAASATVTHDTVNANPYPADWAVNGVDLTLYANWSTACRVYGNVYVGPSTRRPLANISVTLMDGGAAISSGVLTATNGYFVINPTRVLPSGDYTLYATDPSGNYQDTYVTVQVAQNGFGAANIYMMPANGGGSGGGSAGGGSVLSAGHAHAGVHSAHAPGAAGSSPGSSRPKADGPKASR
jgi:hypothetical protein